MNSGILLLPKGTYKLNLRNKSNDTDLILGIYSDNSSDFLSNISQF